MKVDPNPGFRIQNNISTFVTSISKKNIGPSFSSASEPVFYTMYEPFMLKQVICYVQSPAIANVSLKAPD